MSRFARALAFYTFVLATVTALVVPAHADSDITLEDIFGENRLVDPLPSRIQWVGDGSAVSYYETMGEGDNERQAFVVQSVPSGKKRVVCFADTAAVPGDLGDEDTKFSIGTYKWSPDGDQIIFLFKGDLFTMEAKDGKITRRTFTEGEEKDPEYSPDGKQVGYTRDHDIYVFNLAENKEYQLTTTGSDDVLNGILDWVYMEELFTRGNVKAFWWSNDGKRIAFLQIQEHPVKEFPLVDWIPVRAEYELQHYPKAGDDNPIVRVGIVGAKGGDIVWSDTDTSDDSYIARMYWLGDDSGVAMEKLNRAQDKLDLLIADAATGKTRTVFTETWPTWVNVNYLKHYYQKNTNFLWGSESSGHSHLYMFSRDGKQIRQLTDGNWEVVSLAGVDEKGKKIYFESNAADIKERHLHVIGENGKGLKQITTESGNHSVTMSPDNKYFIDRFSTETRPTVVSVYAVSGKKVFEIGDSQSERLAKWNLQKPEFLTVDGPEGRSYNAMITRPTNFDANKKYPAIVYVYGGPHVQVVRRRFTSRNLWSAYMAERGYVVFSIDNRGAGYHGKAWEDWVLKDMGNHELEDQLVGVDYLKSLPYIDDENIGIWGWSYGGYMTLMAMFKAGDVFKAGTSVAPVSDWHLYDTIYTERYMKRPQDNPDGYEVSAPLNFAEDLQGALLLMHGDADDNVHAQNSIKMVQKLIKAGKDFDFMIYPQKYHGISGAAEQVHLYTKMTRFFDRHLKGGQQESVLP